MIIQTIQNIIWNIGGFLITMAFILFVLTYIDWGRIEQIKTICENLLRAKK